MEMVTKVVPVRAVELSIGAFCTEFRCEQLCDNGIFWYRGQMLVGLRDINMEMVTEVVPVRAVELSIGAFCTAFRCEQLRDNCMFGIGARSSTIWT